MIVPLLDEADIVERLVRDLRALSYPNKLVEIVLACSIRERQKNGENPTFNAAQAVAKRSQRSADFRVNAFESPSQTGYVATQINYAIKQMGSRIDPEDFIALYNADSKPSLSTLHVAASVIAAHKTSANVLQQSSLFTRNARDMIRRREYGALANAIHQSLWTLKHEMTMIRVESRTAERYKKTANVVKRIINSRFTVCVGHGLFVRKSYYDKHPLNEDASIEDTQYGLYQSLQHTPVYLIPVMENSESPSTFARQFAQKRSWFGMVFDLNKLLVSSYRRPSETGRQRAEFMAIATQAVLLYIAWFTHSVVLWGTLLAALVYHSGLLTIMWLMFYFLYWIVPSLMLANYHRTLVGTRDIRIRDVFIASTLGSSAIFTHSLGPWFAVYDHFRGNKTRKKTER